MDSKILGDVLIEMCRVLRQGDYRPILEEDIVCWMYSQLLSRGVCTLSHLHASTRIVGGPNPNEKFDLVIGAVERRDDERPAVAPESVIEVKMFPKGMNGPQHRVHYEELLRRDLRKLGSLEARISKFAMVFDEANYLVGTNREELLLSSRDTLVPGCLIGVVAVRRNEWDCFIR